MVNMVDGTQETPMELTFSYKYPFSATARETIQSLNIQEISQKYIEAGVIRVQEAIDKGAIEFVDTKYEELMYTYLLSYVYARMIISALNDKSLIKRYAYAEAKRAEAALMAEEPEGTIKVAKDIAVEAGVKDDLFYVRFQTYLRYMPKEESFALVRQKLAGGLVYLQKERFIKVLSVAIAARVARGLPISIDELPKEVIEAAKKIKVPVVTIKAKGGKGNYSWVEKLLSTPITDVRHRTVNLILAPYLVNVKGLSPEDASKIIIDYIERCKELNPNTKINEAYIRYQCEYAKKKGLKPLSFKRAQEMLQGVANLE